MLKLIRSYQEKDAIEQLISDCKKGKRTAQQQLYTRFSGKMLGICLRYLGDPDDAEDVMVTAFMKVFTHLDTYKGDGSFEGWIRRIMVNEALTELRKKNKLHFEPVEAAHYTADGQAQENSMEAEELLKMVQSLPSGYRTVFNLYAIEGFSHKEIAESLGITESTSKSQLNRARNMLKNALNRMEEVL